MRYVCFKREEKWWNEKELLSFVECFMAQSNEYSARI